jgi:hypothetical protein
MVTPTREVKLDDLIAVDEADDAVEVLAKILHDADAPAWGSPGQPHWWDACNDEHRERYRELARARLGVPSARP